MTLRNNATFLPEAIESLLNQTYQGFGLVLVDDQSSDQTEAVCRSYAERDRRITYFRNDRHLGMTATWRRAFELVREMYPSAPYFAWASDHDRWAPTWLETLVGVLDTNANVVLAYPVTQRMSDVGKLSEVPEPARFETSGLTDIRQRWKALCRQRMLGAGNMVYGLARAEAIGRAGVYRDVILPDRLLMAELTLQGQFLQVPEVLWFRRELSASSIQRQRRTLFGPRRAPMHAYLPWPLTHVGTLLFTYGLKRGAVSRVALTGMCMGYLGTQLVRHYQKLRSRRALEAKRRVLEAKRQQRRAAQPRRKSRKDAMNLHSRSTQDTKPRVYRWLQDKINATITKPVSAQISEQITTELLELRRSNKTLKTANHELVAAIASMAQRQEATLAKYDDLLRAINDMAHRQDQVATPLLEQINAELLEVTRRDKTLTAANQGLVTALASIAERHEAALTRSHDVVRLVKDVAQRQDQLFAFGRAWRGRTVVPDDQQFHNVYQKVSQDQRTLLGPDRLFILWQAVKNVSRMRLPAAEVGCYRGGGSFFLAEAFVSILGCEVEFHAFDTFKGHPDRMVSTHDPFHKPGMFDDVVFNEVREYLSRFQKLTIHRGEFSRVVADVKDSQFGLVHLDTDLYRSTLTGLEYFGPRIAHSGLIIVDDYRAPKCPGVRDAVQAFLGEGSDYTCWELPTEQALLVKMSASQLESSNAGIRDDESALVYDARARNSE